MLNDLLNLFVAAVPGGIEAQEAQGQREFVRAETLPIKCLYCERKQIEAMGIVYGEPVDDLFVKVQLPEGWRKERTDHSMWSNLLDAKGRKRASIFYKAAFYDLDAHIGLNAFHTIDTEFLAEDGFRIEYGEHAYVQYVVKDADGKACFTSERLPEDHGYMESDKVRAQCKEWLNEHRPQWGDPLAYWD